MRACLGSGKSNYIFFTLKTWGNTRKKITQMIEKRLRCNTLISNQLKNLSQTKHNYWTAFKGL